MTTFETEFKFGDTVAIDGTAPIVGHVVGFCFYPHGYQVQVSWWNSGALVEQWIGSFRLKLVEERR